MNQQLGAQAAWTETGESARHGLALASDTVWATMTLYRAIDIWERIDNRTVVRYRCFESFSSGKFTVQSADFFHDGENSAVSDRQFVQLLTEADPTQRSSEYATLADAIAAHKAEFS